MKLHIHQPCLKALGTNTPFLSRVSTLELKPSGGYSRQNGVSALRAFKTEQVHLVHILVESQSVCQKLWSVESPTAEWNYLWFTIFLLFTSSLVFWDGCLSKLLCCQAHHVLPSYNQKKRQVRRLTGPSKKLVQILRVDIQHLKFHPRHKKIVHDLWPSITWHSSWHVKGLHCNASNVIILPLAIDSFLIYRVS
jgi:hypothetical protein